MKKKIILVIAFPVAHKNILLSNSLPQAAIHLKLKCKSLLIPWGGGKTGRILGDHMVFWGSGGGSVITEKRIIENLLAMRGIIRILQSLRGGGEQWLPLLPSPLSPTPLRLWIMSSP